MAEELVVSESPIITLLVCAVSIPVVVAFFFVWPVWVGLLAVIGALVVFHQGLFRFAYAVTVNSDGAIGFRSVLRRRTIRANDVESICLRRWALAEGSLGEVKVSFRGGSVLLPRSERTHAFAERVRAFNPGVRTRGL